MARVYRYQGLVPVVREGTYVHPTAVLIGDVIVGRECYIAPCAVLRGDMGRLVVEDGANIQDHCTLHGIPGQDLVVGEDCRVGHGAVLHGCFLGRGVLVGMNSVVMDAARIGEKTMLGAMSFVGAGKEIPSGVLATGIPARVVRELDEAEREWSGGLGDYKKLTSDAVNGDMEEAEALREIEEGRGCLDWSGYPMSMEEYRRARGSGRKVLG